MNIYIVPPSTRPTMLRIEDGELKRVEAVELSPVELKPMPIARVEQHLAKRRAQGRAWTEADDRTLRSEIEAWDAEHGHRKGKRRSKGAWESIAKKVGRTPAAASKRAHSLRVA